MPGPYLANRSGITKLLTVILGILCIIMAAISVDRVWKEEVFLGVVIGCLVVSILYLAAHIFIKDMDLHRTNKAFDSGFHLLGAVLILVSASLMIYSAVHLRWDTEYLCSGGIDRGIPCIYDAYEHSRSGNLIPPEVIIPGTIPNADYGPSGYGRLNNGFPEGRFFGASGGNWLTWLASSKGHLFEKCYEILPRVLNCNRYYELKIAAGVMGLMNGIMYVVAGIMVLSSN